MKLFISDKNFFTVSIITSVIVFIVVIILNIIPKPDFVPIFTKHLPLFNAILNGTCSVLLVTSFYFIKQKNISVHKKINITAFFLSCIFLISYILYHYFTEETKFPIDNPLRPVYLFILISHIILAALVLPFILLSFYFGLNMKIPQHKKIVRWSFPIWLYVTITGVIVYLMISPYYAS
jgi:putative membrane protein